MQLRKITDRAQQRFHIAEDEILMMNYADIKNPTFFAFDASKIVRQVDKNYYIVAKVGNDYKTFETQLPCNIEDYRVTRDEAGNRYFCNYEESIIFGFNNKGKRILEWSVYENGQGHLPYDINYQSPDFFWLAYPTGQTVTQLSITKRKEIFRIGDYSWDDEPTPLNYPESLFVKDEFVFIPNMGDNKLFRFDTISKDLDLINIFEEGIWQYGENNFGTFIGTQTGIYEVEE